MRYFKMGGSGPDRRGIGKVEGLGNFRSAGVVMEESDKARLKVYDRLVRQGLAVEVEEQGVATEIALEAEQVEAGESAEVDEEAAQFRTEIMGMTTKELRAKYPDFYQIGMKTAALKEAIIAGKQDG